MSARKADLKALFDRAAEALVLVDLDDAASRSELREYVVGVCEALDQLGLARVAGDLRVALDAIDADGIAALGALGDAFTAARAASASAERPPKKQGRRSQGTKREGGAAEPPAAMPLAGDVELLHDFGVRAAEHLDDADENLLALEMTPTDREAVDAVFRAFHTIKGMAGFLALDAISTFAHEAESLLAEARATGTAVQGKTVQGLFVAVDKMRILVAEASGVTTGVRDATEPAAPSGATAGDRRSGEERRTGDRRVEAAVKSSRAGTMRVDEERLDSLLDAIGELVIAESMVSASIRNDGEAALLGGKLDQLDKITRELQQMATSLRMVPLRAVFRRMARLVHDVAGKAGKRVEFVTSGEDTELDKTVVDRIEDPLVHALRNAIDHGIESAEERKAAGKSEIARIELRAFHAGGAIHIEVRDDGRGINRDRVTARAVAEGIIDPEATGLEGRSLLDVLCIAGFSTADSLTDVSGRGVGMDVVRRTVEELRGRLDVTSETGAGTTFSIRLPVTLAIIDGMVLRVGEERFILPLLAIERSVRPDASEIASIAGRGEMLAVDGEPLLPILRLHRLFEVESAETDPASAVVVVVSDNGTRAGLLACELLGQQQTVIKPLGEGLPDLPGIAGGAVMPDGRVGLILDAAGLVRSAHDRGGE